MKAFDVADILQISDIPALLQRIEQRLSETAATNNPAFSEPLGRLLHTKSKRLRSILVIAASQTMQTEVTDKLIDGCVAVELIHIASLIHDDIIDNAETRWGVETISAREGVNQAILTGDFLFARAGVAGARVNVRAAELVSSTIAELCEGESREYSEEFNVDRSIESMTAAINGKTGALVSAACQMGGICVGASDKQLEALAAYGRNFGLAFQLIDDILDFVSTDEIMGKPVGNDVNEGVYTMPVILGLAGSDRDEILKLIDKDNGDYPRLVGLLMEKGYMKQTLQKATDYTKAARASLADLPNSAALATLPDAYINWALSGLVDQKYASQLANH